MKISVNEIYAREVRGKHRIIREVGDVRPLPRLIYSVAYLEDFSIQ